MKIVGSILICSILVSSYIFPNWINSPEDIEKWFKKDFSYQREEGEYWKTPKETINDKGGDCEDFAFLASKILFDMDYNNHVIVVISKNKNVAHAICIFFYDYRYAYFSNKELIITNETNFKDMMNKECPDWVEIRFVDQNKNIYKRLRR